MTRFRVSPLVFVFAAVMIYFGKGFMLVSYFVAVVLHEMAHAEVARKLGYVLDRIRIMPYGASLTGNFEGMGYKDEFKIALAGPVTNICLAVLFTAVWWLVPTTYFFTETFVLANVFTAITNLLPIFPLDGGRALLAFLSRKLPRQKAYRILRWAGSVICLGFLTLFVVSLFYGVNFTFALMAFFVLSGTLFPDKFSTYQRLYSMAYRSEKLKHGLLVKEVMVSHSVTLHALTKMLNASYYYRFVVVDENMRTVGIVTESQLEAFLVRYSRQTQLRALPLER